ncbi:TBC1 DOMAIN FAMILY MEMBER GTPASE-ACTIVATING PROTEIN [Salix koriyanagi]|uniref:TBC1 DOMAIN FAMILY MEMBER GTPASE-ACTIVATING PROTEIN n=1 Tax=Salix koriyanagi TaxID=2511006 RepID=A0A9Q0W1K4_9ROSI|nr:TBC1 DOMAIN FAMILY MEMBER GTPASE-ACTIVATING PROTEIN [Salix koriyanagi]
MGSASIEQEMPAREGIRSRFENLRGVQWRIDLGILPSPSSSSVDDLRRVTAESRRRYAGLRRRLLVDPHLSKDGRNSPDPVIDNPLSQNPDSTWGRFFRNAELEKTLDQDLSRLYPEHDIQSMVIDKECMNSWLLFYMFFMLMWSICLKCASNSMEDEIGSHGNAVKVKSLNELDPEIQTTVLLTDAYGAEGELGIVISEKFMEHDAYCMFDALMSGSHGSVAVVDFYSHSPAHGSHSGLPPVIETSAALYHLLSVVDSSLHSHLVELGVEPQYFALRWLRVLFGREFSLENLLLIWDEIFAADNNVTSEKGAEDDADSGFRIFRSPRGALIPAMSVSMILHLRSSLLATEHATTCLQRLLNFPENIDLRKLIDKAKSLQALALDTNMSSVSPPFDGIYNHSVVKGHSHALSSDSISPKTLLNVEPDSYWEEKWRVLHKTEELKHDHLGKLKPSQKKRWTEKVRLPLSRTESAPAPVKVGSGKKVQKSFIRRSLLEDLSHELGVDEDIGKSDCHEVSGKDHQTVEVEEGGPDSVNNGFTCSTEERCLSGNAGSEENSSVFSDPIQFS